MTKKYKAALLAISAALLLTLGWATRAEGVHVKQQNPPARPVIDHAQLVWSYALEWCESRGNDGAVNPKDRDGTPSYGAFQFKPDTLAYFAQKYGVEASSSVMDASVQRQVLEAMILDEKHIDWHWQFPDCVKRLGLPPA